MSRPHALLIAIVAFILALLSVYSQVGNPKGPAPAAAQPAAGYGQPQGAPSGGYGAPPPAPPAAGYGAPPPGAAPTN